MSFLMIFNITNTDSFVQKAICLAVKIVVCHFATKVISLELLKVEESFTSQNLDKCTSLLFSATDGHFSSELHMQTSQKVLMYCS